VLLLAATNGRADIASAALEAERGDPAGDVTALLAAQVDPVQGTALHVACSKGYVDVVRLLLLRGAPAALRDGEGKFPFEVATAKAPSDKLGAVHAAFEAELFKHCASGSVEDVAALIDGGVSLACQQAGYSPIAWAELFEQSEIAQYLEGRLSGNSGKEASTNETHMLPADQAAATTELTDVSDANVPTLEEELARADSEVVEAARQDVQRFAQAPAFRSSLQQAQQMLLWPPLLSGCRHRRGDSDGAAGVPVTLPPRRGAPLPVLLPFGMDASTRMALLQIVEGAILQVCGGSASPLASSISTESPVALVPKLTLPWPEADSGRLLWPWSPTVVGQCSAQEEAGAQRRSGATGAAKQATGDINFILDGRLAAETGKSFCISIVRHDNGGGSLELLGQSVCALQEAAGVLRQLLLHHARLDPCAGQLQLPCMAVEADETEERPSVFCDIWRLAQNEADRLVMQLADWRVGRLFVPLPEQQHPDPGARTAFLRRIFELRSACHAACIELVPVLLMSPGCAMLVGMTAAGEGDDSAPAAGGQEDAASQARWQEARGRTELLVEILAQFHGVRELGLIFLGPSAELHAGVALAQLWEVQRLALVAGLGGPEDLSVALWLPATEVELLHRLGDRLDQNVPRASRGHPSRLSLVLCVGTAVGQLGGLTAAAGMAEAHGMSVRFCATATADGSSWDDASAAGLLPAFVWHDHGAHAQALHLASLALAARRTRARGTVVEVPVHGAPWCGTGTRVGAAWCKLTAFLAVGVLRHPEAAVAILGGDGTMKEPEQDAAANHRGTLLAAHLLGILGSQCLQPDDGAALRRGPPPKMLADERGSASSSHTANAAASTRSLNGAVAGGIRGMAPLALSLWDSAPLEVPPRKLPWSLMGLLHGQLPPVLSESIERREAFLADAGAWHRSITKRRDALQRHLSANKQVHGLRQNDNLLATAVTGVEWLRFLLRLLLLLLKHADVGLCQQGESGLPAVRAALQVLPPAKVSDTRNGFLGLIDRTISSQPEASDLSASEQLAAKRALWDGCLRLGSALELEPWVSFEAAESAP